MKEGISHGRRPEFVGGGLMWSSGGWSQVLSWVNGVYEWRILFVEDLIGVTQAAR